MQNESLSEKQSLEIIEDMIHTAKQEQTGAAYYLTIWGILTGLYCLSLYIGFTYKLEWYPMRGFYFQSVDYFL